MAQKGQSFSIVRLNTTDLGWGVVDDATGALTHIDSLALRLTKERAQEVANQFNAEAAERGAAAVKMPVDPDKEPEGA